MEGTAGALIGGTTFIFPGLVLILGLSALFLAGSPPSWVKGAAAGAGAAVAAVAVQAGASLMPTSWQRAQRGSRVRWVVYLGFAGAASATVGPWLVLVLAACGVTELSVQAAHQRGTGQLGIAPVPLLGIAAAASGGLLALVWVAFKVGALSFGGGFVIIPLMQGDAVNHYHWMTNAQFLNAVALGQVTPGPVVQTVAQSRPEPRRHRLARLDPVAPGCPLGRLQPVDRQG